MRIRRETLGVDKALAELIKEGDMEAFKGIFSVDSADEALLKNLGRAVDRFPDRTRPALVVPERTRYQF